MSVSKVEVVVDGNVNPLQQAMDKAGDIVDRAGHKMSKKFDKAFGAGMIAGLAVGMVKDVILKPFEVASEIKTGAKDLGVTAEEFQALQAGADASGMGVSEFIQQIKDSADPLAQAKKVMDDFRGSINLTNEDIGTLTGMFTPLKNVAVSVAQEIAKAYREIIDVITFLATPGARWSQVKADSAAQSAMANSKSGEISAGFARAVNSAGGGTVDTISDKVQTGALGALANVTSRQQAGAFIGGSDTAKEIQKQTVAIEKISTHMSEMTRTIAELIKIAGF